jgi:hypothetical protein
LWWGHALTLQHGIRAPADKFRKVIQRTERRRSRAEIVGIFTKQPAISQLIATVLMKQSNQWAVLCGSFMSLGTIAPVSGNPIAMLLAEPGT